MKKIILTILIVLSLKSFSQKSDSVYVLCIYDEMEEKKTYLPSCKIAVINDEETKGFSVSAFIDENNNGLKIRDLSVEMVNLGGCNENNQLIFMFVDSSKITIKSWNKFNCDGSSWFSVTDSDIEKLSTKKILKIKLINGRTYDSLTGEVTDDRKLYFVELFNSIKINKIKTIKK